MLARRGLLAWPDYLRALNECDRVVFSGGILQDWSFEGITFFALRILAASIFKVEPSLWGAGLGPIRRLAAKRITKKALGRVKTAWLRDLRSLELFDQLANVSGSLGADWSWFFPVKPTKLAFANAPIGVNLRHWDFSEWRPSVEAQSRHIDRHVIGLPARPGDKKVIKQLFPASTIIVPETFEAAGEICQNLSFGIAMRYHLALAMLRASLPVKLVAYDEKVRNLACEAGVALQEKSPVANFRQAQPDFFSKNHKRFDEMLIAFKEYFKLV
jgi:polysaccharide pyruvyl transferase WcaK-like protein